MKGESKKILQKIMLARNVELSRVSENCTQDQNCGELNIETRKTLYGRKSTVREWVNEIVRLKLGDARRHQAPLTNEDIGQKLGITRQYVLEYVKLAITHKMATADPNNPTKLIIPTSSQLQKTFEKLDTDSFANEVLVKEWVENMLTKKGGKPIKSWRQRFICLKNFCNTFKIKPEQLIIDKKTFLQILTNAKMEFDKGTVQYDRTTNTRGYTANTESAFHGMKMALRDFVQFHGIALPKNIGGIASGKVINHGQYADIRLTLDEIEQAEKYIEENHGIDSDLMRLFSVGVCTGARASALFRMPLTWTEITNPIRSDTIERLGLSPTVFVMKAYETKTESNWTKYVIRPRALESLRLHKAKNKFATITSLSSINNVAMKDLADQLREVYRFLGKEFVHDGYFMRKPFHALRHIAAQYWIKISKANLTLVCMACGWKSDLELKASYGEIPPEMTIEMIGTVTA